MSKYVLSGVQWTRSYDSPKVMFWYEPGSCAGGGRRQDDKARLSAADHGVLRAHENGEAL